MNEFKLAISQANPTVGDIEGNFALAKKEILSAHEAKADIILFTELFLSGYPLEDLARKPVFLQACKNSITKIVALTSSLDIAVIVGAPLFEDKRIYNAAFFIAGGTVLGISYKRDLPNYGEFDEKRIFSTIKKPQTIFYKGICFGIPICEDIWNDMDICKEFMEASVDIILVPNASPYQRNKLSLRKKVVNNYTNRLHCPVVYANQIGGQDGLIFDGSSFAFNADGTSILQMPQFTASLSYIKWQKIENKWRGESADVSVDLLASEEATDYSACVLGLQDYVRKNNFTSVMLGLSGGIDSALCAAIAVDALGASNVYCFMLPYYYTSEASQRDAVACAKALGCFYDKLPIATIMEAISPILLQSFGKIEAVNHREQGLWHENLQSRLRGTILMAISNKLNYLLLTTGNKSELAVGYCTLYGDTNGGFNPIKDLYKTEVYKLAKWRNKNFINWFKGKPSIVIAENILNKPASAELRPGQKDEDSLPPYDVLDKILYELLENDDSVATLLKFGFEVELIKKIENLIYNSEYKRRQAAPGVKLSLKDFNKDRRYPITNKFRDNNSLF
ncbi:NAD+ synthase [Bartonella sp. TP]|uniref:NAD+ synthase n=1 Tax=Bartonella sp. TP TaxID=3057550 RepID=UPI0025B1B0F6|nr:NAD+ synthase [Bartonella sp. TP]WJW79889.1 NAD+ synthase [Bartonella sp. TP]